MRTGNAKRVLFLVDRIELENQAWKAFVRYLKNDLRTVIYKENRDDWRKAEIVVSTVQSLQFNNKYQRIFSPTDFDLVISDEAHRSIGGNSRAVFEYFIGYKLGLTATPKDYLKKIDPARISQRDPREWERRQLFDTYKTFGCESGVPTFRYSLIDGVREGYLVNPVVVDARTEITTELFSEEGYAIMQENEDGELVEQTFFGKDFEKKFFSDKTNRIFCETFLKNAIRDPLSGEIGKTIIFCVRQDHATRITQKLNELADAMFPGKYNSDFAVQVTSVIQDAQQMAVSFANNNLNGHTRFLEGYISARTRVCVTVGMMTTGYDCEDLLNIVLLRPIFSPTDFIQIKGRGTRKYTFRYIEKEAGQIEEHRKEKDKFKLFDFFAVCEYFEEKFDYDEVIGLPPLSPSGPPLQSPPPSSQPGPDSYTNVDPDPLKSQFEYEVSLFGMKIDRKFFERFEDKVKATKDMIEKLEEDIKSKETEIQVRGLSFSTAITTPTFDLSTTITLAMKKLAAAHEAAEKRVLEHIDKNTSDKNRAKQFIRQGLDLLQVDCPFCGQDLKTAADLLEAYREFFDDAFRTFQTELNQTAAALGNWNVENELTALLSSHNANMASVKQWEPFIGTRGPCPMFLPS